MSRFTPRIALAAALCSLPLQLTISGATAAAQNAAGPAARGVQLVTVGANTQVSSDQARFAHYEHLAGAHPRDPNKMLACSMLTDPARGHDHSVVYTTTDGGRSWKKTLDADWAKALTGDPVCVYGAGDTAFFVALTTGSSPRMKVARSADAGLTWTSIADMPFIDRENLVVDRTGGKYNGRIYINGTESLRGIENGTGAAVSLFRSTDGGRTFGGPALRTAMRPEHVVGMGNSVVLSDGQIVTLFGHEKEATARDEDNLRRGPIAVLRVAISNDGGESFTSTSAVSDWYMARARSQGAHIPWLAVDETTGPFKDRLYAVWDDYREGRLTVLLSVSSDKGKSWSRPVHVVDDRVALNPEQEGPDQIMPLVAVNKDGVVGVAWYDRRDQRDDHGWDLRFAASLDGGESFAPSVKVSSAANRFGGSEIWPARGSVSGGGTRLTDTTPPAKTPISLSFGVNSFFFSSGHTSGFVATADGVFHPIWEDNRTGVSQLWTAPVVVHGVASKNGAPELAGLIDATDKVTLELRETGFDRATGLISAQLRVRNTSKDTVIGPLRARVLALASQIGVPELLGAQTSTGGVGALLDLTQLLPVGRLLPDSTSAPRTLSIRVTDVRSLKEADAGSGSRFGLATLDLRIYAAGVTVNRVAERR